LSPELPRAGAVKVREATAAPWRRLDLDGAEHGSTISIPSTSLSGFSVLLLDARPRVSEFAFARA